MLKQNKIRKEQMRIIMENDKGTDTRTFLTMGDTCWT